MAFFPSGAKRGRGQPRTAFRTAILSQLPSMLALSATSRLLAILPVLLLVWAAVGWAMAD